ncbi:MAG: DUF1566 domain-containing protein [Hylemonella sp.]|uniref:Lcl domain-containing protein n=1 Tax=Hylemonella sp. TaxID=2066020 RepID=UPI0022BAB881|nr:DUF1566 domain-containing protein [Hylemonella sp.]MCZ8251377.1 DUF1566 domain-containing protein [Hylemonella sp.]
MRRTLLLSALLLVLGAAGAQTRAVEAPAPSADGAYVIDPRSKLAWPRCVVGMEWNGRTCTGEPRLMSHGEAAAMATARFKAEGVAWRLPRLTELRRWAGSEQGRELFPGDPQDWTWTSTSRIDTTQSSPYAYDNITRGSLGTQDRLGVQQGWAVHMGSGEARGDVARKTALIVRLVRPQP